jgi:O-antigen/teichoic acid export membrane protein
MTSESVPEEKHNAPLTGRRLAFGAVAMGVSSVLKIAIQLVMLPVMARLLGPGEFGLYALALPTVTFMQMLADGGLGNSLSREPESSKEIWTTAFWLMHGICAALAALVVGWSFVLAYLAHQPRLPAIMSTLSLSLLLMASASLSGAKLMRRARMAAVPIADLVSSLIGALLGVACALHHAGAWSLVVQYLSSFTIKALILNIAAPHFPDFKLNMRALRPHLAVGGAIVGGKLSEFMGRLFENVLVSRALGAPMLGAYSFGIQTTRFLCEAASNPCWASLYVQAIRSGREEVIKIYYNLSRLLGFILFPATILISASAPLIVPMLLGASWRAAIPVIEIILPSYAILVICNQSTAMLYAYGRSDITLWIAAGLAGLRVAAVLLAPFYGLLGVSIGVALANVLGALAYVILPARVIGSQPLAIAKELAGAFFSALLAGALCRALIQMHPQSLLWSICSLMLSSILYFAVLALMERGRLKEDYNIVRRMLFAK